ncbi:AAA family ATPase [Pseudomonas sp. F1_0610]|uniref:AAA family ATPase n=1 Tax=Pseudomonas sp. F1_0610 TaxID=3114284 RepID=UPI0039C49497
MSKQLLSAWQETEKNGNLEHWLEVIPQLNALATTPQAPEFHGEGDVWTHTKMVVRALLDDSTYQQATDDERFALCLSALLHDIAKPSTTVRDEHGTIRQPGHSRRGAIDARIILWRHQLDFQLRESICRLIQVHQVPFFALEAKQKQTPEFLLRKFSHCFPVWQLCCLAKADMQGRIYAGKQNVLQDIELFGLLAQELDCYNKAATFADNYSAFQYFNGANIQPEFRLHPSQTGSNVIMLSGLPATGKNTWVAQHYPDLPVASYDDARKKLGLVYGKNEGAVAHLVQSQVKVWLAQKQDFIWNATHLTEEVRQRTLNTLLAYHATVTLVHLEQAESVLLKRNHLRDTSLSNSKLISMFNKWEVPLPTEAEYVLYHAH